MAVGIESLVEGFAIHAMKMRAAFSEQSSTLHHTPHTSQHSFWAFLAGKNI
jgi:hypothetical protein